MEKTQEKIQLLLRIVHRLNEAGVEWALGASMLLYFKGITSDFHDIDLMVTDCDAECVRTIFRKWVKVFHLLQFQTLCTGQKPLWSSLLILSRSM